jgi:nucleotide-binding universal stress UspA family protein
MNTQKILLVLSTTRESPKTIQYALEQARSQNALLIVLCVIDTELPSSILDKLENTGFVGEKPGEELFEKILEEYKQRAERKLGEIRKLSESQGIPVETLLKQGDLVQVCLETISEQEVSLVIVGKKRESKLSQFIFASPIRKIEKNSPCPVKVVEESD